jgi:hypothetical protein
MTSRGQIIFEKELLLSKLLENDVSIDASYQISLHLTKGFQKRRLKCEKLTHDRQRMPSDGKS